MRPILTETSDDNDILNIIKKSISELQLETEM